MQFDGSRRGKKNTSGTLSLAIKMQGINRSGDESLLLIGDPGSESRLRRLTERENKGQENEREERKRGEKH